MKKYNEAKNISYLYRWRVPLEFSGDEHISPASLKRAEVRKLFYSRKLFSETMRYNEAKKESPTFISGAYRIGLNGEMPGRARQCISANFASLKSRSSNEKGHFESRRYKKVYIEITNICNLKCNFCPSTKRQLKYIDKDSFSYIINQVKPFTDYIYFHLMGEPLLHPELASFLQICDDNSIKVNITTNGTLLKRVENILLTSYALRKVSISLHSFEANEEAEKIEKYIADTMDFVKNASEKGIICELRLWNKESEGITASNNCNDQILMLIQKMLNLDFSLKTAMEQSGNIKLKNYVFISLAQKFEWPDIDRDVVDEGVFCYGLRDQFGILVDGTVVPCCLDSEGNIPLGNIFSQPLKDILDSDRAAKIYEGFTGRIAVEELCKKCGYAKRHKR